MMFKHSDFLTTSSLRHKPLEDGRLAMKRDKDEAYLEFHGAEKTPSKVGAARGEE